MKKGWIWIIGIVLVVVIIVGFYVSNQNREDIKIGFIGAITGPVAKYGSYEAVNLAVEDINNEGGIKGRKINLIAEDGKCDAREAVNAVNKLIGADGVKIILGGHCTPESLAIAPIVEQNKVIMLASITTSPGLTNMGDYVFRTSPVSVVQSVLVANTAFNKLNLRKIAIIYEQTDYARPIAEKMRDEFKRYGGEVAIFEAYTSGTADFRTLLAKAKSENVDSLFLSAQSPDAALNFMKQVKEIGLRVQLFGNDVAGGQSVIDQIPELYEGFIFGLPNFDTSAPKTKEFIEKYNSKYNTKNLPYGIWTAESYDGVFIIKKCIEEYGETPEKVKECLYNIKDFEGVSGKISIDSNGDGVRDYFLKVVRNGTILDLE